MAASTALASILDVESFINEYFGAWQGTDEDRIMSYFGGINLLAGVIGILPVLGGDTGAVAFAAGVVTGPVLFALSQTVNALKRIEYH